MYLAWRQSTMVSDADCAISTRNCFDSIDLTSCLKSMLEDTLEYTDNPLDFLSTDDVNEILNSDDEIVDKENRKSAIGYPTRPLYRELGSILEQWVVTGYCPALKLPDYDLLNETGYDVTRRELFTNIETELLSVIAREWYEWEDEERRSRLKQIITMLGKRGMLDLLGLRKTAGTVDIWPPPRQVLLNTFNQLNKPGTTSKLTVGARALTKHCHRDQTSSWWGVNKGSEADKSDHAVGILNLILDSAHWINIHLLPHDVSVIEVRNEQGYGLRWSADGLQFRGFLEPQMADGHSVGWRH